MISSWMKSIHQCPINSTIKKTFCGFLVGVRCILLHWFVRLSRAKRWAKMIQSDNHYLLVLSESSLVLTLSFASIYSLFLSFRVVGCSSPSTSIFLATLSFIFLFFFDLPTWNFIPAIKSKKIYKSSNLLYFSDNNIVFILVKWQTSFI